MKLSIFQKLNFLGGSEAPNFEFHHLANQNPAQSFHFCFILAGCRTSRTGKYEIIRPSFESVKI